MTDVQPIRIWHPMYDPYHCGFRMLRLLSVQPAFEIEVLFILDFYLLFPFLLHKASMPETATSSKLTADRWWHSSSTRCP
jgi:hypothetical protein